MGVHSGGSQPQLCQGLQNSRRSRSPWFSGKRHSFQFNTGPRPYIKGMFHKRPPPKLLVPAWDLSRALWLLAEPPFEPLDQASLLDLSRKTAFLVEAACGRRVSEIHALSTAERHLEFRASAVHLLPRAGFLAKNQTMDFSPKHIVLPDLRKASKSPDCGPWCPVRALKFYLHRTKPGTKPYRGEMDSLFLTTSKPVRVASKQTLSRWIISVIRDSISREELRLAGTHVRAMTCALRQWHGHFTKDRPSRTSWRHKAGVLHPPSSSYTWKTS